METDIFYKHWKTFLTKCIFLQFSICKKAENVKKITIYAYCTKTERKIRTFDEIDI